MPRAKLSSEPSPCGNRRHALPVFLVLFLPLAPRIAHGQVACCMLADRVRPASLRTRGEAISFSSRDVSCRKELDARPVQTCRTALAYSTRFCRGSRVSFGCPCQTWTWNRIRRLGSSSSTTTLFRHFLGWLFHSTHHKSPCVCVCIACLLMGTSRNTLSCVKSRMPPPICLMIARELLRSRPR